MKVVFSIFDQFENAEKAVGKLIANEFDVGEMNVIILESIAKNAMDEEDLERIKVQKTKEVNQQQVHGLRRILGGQQAVNLPHVGEVYAAGRNATIMINNASAPGAVEDGLQAALEEFNIPQETAEEYRKAIEAGSLIFFIRTEDQRAPKAVEILRYHDAREILSL